jgi:hypothetical protein
MITEEELSEIEMRCNKSQNGPWKAFIEGRDLDSGADFIMTGEGINRGEDIEPLGATKYDIDFIANSKQDIPKLIKEIRELKEYISRK